MKTKTKTKKKKTSAKRKSPAKKKKRVAHRRCASCGHKAHSGPAGCTHFEAGKFCSCK